MSAREVFAVAYRALRLTHCDGPRNNDEDDPNSSAMWPGDVITVGKAMGHKVNEGPVFLPGSRMHKGRIEFMLIRRRRRAVHRAPYTKWTREQVASARKLRDAPERRSQRSVKP